MKFLQKMLNSHNISGINTEDNFTTFDTLCFEKNNQSTEKLPSQIIKPNFRKHFIENYK